MLKIGDSVKLRSQPGWYYVGPRGRIISIEGNTAYITRTNDDDWWMSDLKELELIPVANDILKDLCSK